MSVPGSNLLGMAMGIIAPQKVEYFKFKSVITNAAGVDTTEYEPGVIVTIGSVQAVPRYRFENLGLDMARDYVTWFVSQKVNDLHRGNSGDYIAWNGRKWKIESVTDWVAQDGWSSAICVDIGATDA